MLRRWAAVVAVGLAAGTLGADETSVPSALSADRARSLLHLGTDDVATDRALAEIKDADPLVRRAAVWALARAPAPVARVLDALLLTSTDKDIITREWSARGLCKATPSAVVIQRVGFLLQDSDRGVREQAARCVAAFGPDAARLAPLIARQMGYQLSEVSDSRALVAIGPAARPVIIDSVVRGSLPAARACAVLQPLQDMPLIVPILSAPEDLKRTAAAECLGQLGTEAAPAASALLACLAYRGSWAANAAERALVRIGPGILPLIDAARQNAEPGVRPALDRIAARLKSGSSQAE